MLTMGLRYKMKDSLKIFIDLDGTTVDWHRGLCQLLGIDPYDREAQEILRSGENISGWKFGTEEEIEQKIIAAGYDFWYNLKPLPWAKDLINLCRIYGDVFFLTSPGKYHEGAHAKLDYIWDKFNSRNYILTEHKYTCADHNHVLIDDLRKNINSWIDFGGIPFFWNSQWKLFDDKELLDRDFIRLESLLKALRQTEGKYDSKMQLYK